MAFNARTRQYQNGVILHSVVDVSARHNAQTVWLCMSGPRGSKACMHLSSKQYLNSQQKSCCTQLRVKLEPAAYNLQGLLWIAFVQHPPEMQTVLQGNSQHKPP